MSLLFQTLMLANKVLCTQIWKKCSIKIIYSYLHSDASSMYIKINVRYWNFCSTSTSHEWLSKASIKTFCVLTCAEATIGIELTELVRDAGTLLSFK